ncbi:hypothetical protein BD780_002159 [Clostridium tetanomorphum]|uniref:Uncharacterized protein n=1 Tax=Clostridium tetanomorphum TaxID=1553 RepID=A0A923E9U1_CLOTT|nr:hypothetical protein [Clostridium tetanomorphum]KAJ49486.1 hypothetical protein CTM_22821 [Clostridium tetanomorphum DSM 665]KAJ51437.1 hypothetical protein CTM_12635 [Clostridium tetanomorphum DSM 665]MBC2396530.1 hypothetical protein [Clostridium tetanomorphum]MBP1863856.1 hypothetical protein [Clostridium tetanomorphum]NRS84934.1 hypothetical protein [Clostridium tetanomorphum]
MTECPFLSSSDDRIECFKECALYNYKENDGVCPFKALQTYKVEQIEKYEDFELENKDLDFLRSCYINLKEEYF